MINESISKLTKDLLSRKDKEIREQLAWLIERKVLVVYETEPKVQIDGNELKVTQRIGLQVETEKYIEKLEATIEKLNRVVEAAKVVNRVWSQSNMMALDEAIKELDGEK